MLGIDERHKVLVTVTSDDLSCKSHRHTQNLEKCFHWHVLQSPTQAVTRECNRGSEAYIALLAAEVPTERLDDVPYTEDNEKCAWQSMTLKVPHGDGEERFLL